MKFIQSILACFVLIVVLDACSTKATKETPVESNTDQEEAAPDVKKEKQRTAVGGILEVENFEKWSEVYNREVPADVQIGTLRNLDNPNLIFVTQWTESHNQALQMLTSSETRSIMDEGTMIDEPLFQYYNVVDRNLEDIGDTLRLAVTAEVLNFKSWKEGFDEGEEMWKESSLNLRGLATDADNTNLVYILFSTNDKVTASSFMNSIATKEAISKSGIIGAPYMTWWKITE